MSTHKKSGHPEQPPQLDAWQNTIARMPITLRPTLNQQLAEWPTLFPFEQARLADFFSAADSYSPAELSSLMAGLRSLEAKMDIADASFSQNGETLEFASQIARSAYYPQWRGEVQRVFNAIEARAAGEQKQRLPQKRLVLLVLPRNLPVERQTFSQYWQTSASEFQLTGDCEQFLHALMYGEANAPSIPDLLGSQPGVDPSELWFIDAENWLATSSSKTPATPLSALSFAELKPFRDQFLAQLNTIPRDLSGADQVVASLRRTDWTPWCPAALNSQPRLQRFVVDLFLSGNGALIFSSAFAEWAASEAIRRARPRVVAVRFGMRSKPKPFTSIAIFENQEKVSVLPDQADPPNSAVDAAILARYVWLAAARYPEYEQALCLCIAENLNAGWMIAPPGLLQPGGRVFSPAELNSFVTRWITNRA